MNRSQLKLNGSIALRFLLAKRRAMAMSLAGIVLGVAFFIVTQAQTAGFEKLFVDTILGTNGHIRIQDRFRPSIQSVEARDSEGRGVGLQIELRSTSSWEAGLPEPDRVIQQVRDFSQVTGVASVLRERAIVSNEFRAENIQVMGIIPSEYLSVSDIEKQLIYGDMQELANKPNGILLGSVLAERLQAGLGDTVFLRSAGAARRQEVVGIFRTGVDEYDKRSAFMRMDEARLVFGRRDGVSYLQVTIQDPDEAPAISRHMEGVIQHYTDSWQERERTWLELFRVLKISSGISMSVIILIAGLGMFNTLAIIVMERSREIAILRSMGYSRADIVTIFLLQGMIVLGVGAVLGMLAAWGLTYTLERIPIQIRGIFASDNFVVYWSVWHYVSAVSVASVMVILASWFPARRAARFEPVEIIRGTGG